MEKVTCDTHSATKKKKISGVIVVGENLARSVHVTRVTVRVTKYTGEQN